jgi:hypothetical protein
MLLTKIQILTLLTFILLAGKSNDVFAQCNTTSNLLTENFDGYDPGSEANANNQTTISTYLSGKGETAGAGDNQQRRKNKAFFIKFK